MARKDKFDDAPNVKSYYALWGKHEFDTDVQRDILLHFLADKKLDDEFMKYLDHHFPENRDGVRCRRRTKAR